MELALYDPHRVNLKQCYQFNRWLPKIKAHEPLASALVSITPARPIARWQLMTIAAVLGLILLFALPLSLRHMTRSLLFYLYLLFLLGLYFVPERLYGGTIELIEAKVLRVVEELEKLLMADEMEFSEAAFFQVKENLSAARRELRQQLDLAHRRL
ncbi:MAG: hypothetical protein R2911_08015 [Caldilineaceae bacterium]